MNKRRGDLDKKAAPEAEKTEIEAMSGTMFEIDPEDVTVEELERRLEMTLALGIEQPPSCTEFSCTEYAPPPAT